MILILECDRKVYVVRIKTIHKYLILHRLEDGHVEGVGFVIELVIIDLLTV